MHPSQVSKDHYDFEHYFFKGRWASVWHQLHEVLAVHPSRVLEVGPGLGVFKAVAAIFGVTVESVDIAQDLMPDHVASVVDLPFETGTYDCVCAFQVLEHLPYDESLRALRELLRVSRGPVIVSLPDARDYWYYALHIPGVGLKQAVVPKPWFRAREHIWNGEHYWELNKQGYALGKVMHDFARQGFRVEKHYLVPELTRHRFFVGTNDRDSGHV